MQHVIAREANGVVVSFGLQEPVEFRLGECGVGSKTTGKVPASVTGHDRFQDLPPILGAMDVPLPEHGAFDVAKLVEAEQGVITGAAEMTVIGRALLFPVGLAHGAVHVQDYFPQSPVFPHPFDPSAGEVCQSRQVPGLRQHFGLEARHLAR